MICFKYKSAILTLVKTIKNVRNIHKIVLNMNSAYFSHHHGEDQFKVTFLYQQKDIGVDRHFNFNRLLTETIDTFIGRVSTNVGKVVGKKVNRKKTKLGIEAGNVDIDVKVLNNGIPVKGSTTCYDVFFKDQHKSLILQVEDVNYSVVVNSPWIEVLALPKTIMSGFPVYPSTFAISFADKSDASCSWMRSNKISMTNKNNHNLVWESVGSNYVYIPTQKDVGCKLKLKCIPQNHPVVGPPVEVESENVVEVGPGQCPFETRHKFTQNHLTRGSFRVLSYNILADMYADTDDARDILFTYCAKHALTIDYRKQLFVKEILGYNADIICLQEVDYKIFKMDLITLLERIGYFGHYVQKSTASEGLCCFYPTSRFKHLESHSITFGEEIKSKKNYCSHIWRTVEKYSGLGSKISDLGTCGQVTVLESLDQQGEIIVVGNTHLYFHPDADHIRLLQAGTFIAFLQEIVESVAKKHVGHHVTLVLCGDFNSVPQCGIYKLMTTKEVPENFIDWKSKDETVQGLTLKQPYNLQSACGTPKYTNYTAGFADCLDYIFYQTDRLKVEQVIPMPTEEELKRHIAIPSIVFPSDHIALVADLKWR